MKKENKVRTALNRVFRLSHNENPYGPSPLVHEAIIECANQVNRYPDPHSETLRGELVHMLGRSSDELIIGSGSVELIDIILRNFLGEGENMITGDVTFSAYKIIAEVYRIDCRLAPLKDYCYDLLAMAALCDEKTRLIICANPNNPTGTAVTHQDLSDLLQAVSRDVFVVVDEAYYEYVTDETYPNTRVLMRQHPNLIVLRTFSKIHGLAGLRVGYAIARPHLIERMVHYQPPFTVNLAAAAAARAALLDTGHVAACSARNAEERLLLTNGLRSLGFKVVPSQCNFLYLPFKDHQDRDHVFDLLLKNGILVAKMEPFGDPDALRITLGRHETNQALLESLRHLKREPVG